MLVSESGSATSADDGRILDCDLIVTVTTMPMPSVSTNVGGDPVTE